MPLLKIVLLIALIGTLTSCQQDKEKIIKPIHIEGSSSLAPLTKAVWNLYKTRKPDSKFIITLSSTKEGFQKLISGELNIINASRKITKEEKQLLKDAKRSYLELPVAFVNNQTHKPLTRKFYLYVITNQLNRNERLLNFLLFYMKVLPHIAKPNGFIQLPGTQYQKNLIKLDRYINYKKQKKQ